MDQAAKCTQRDTPKSRTYTVEDVAAMLNIGRTSAYNLVKEGHFKTVRVGNAIRISKKSVYMCFVQSPFYCHPILNIIPLFPTLSAAIYP